MDSPSGDSTNSSFPALFVAKCLVANRLSPGISPYTQVRCEIHPKRFTIMWGGLSSTTSSVQHPLGCKSPCWLVLRIEFLCWFSSLSLEFSCTCSLNWASDQSSHSRRRSWRRFNMLKWANCHRCEPDECRRVEHTKKTSPTDTRHRLTVGLVCPDL